LKRTYIILLLRLKRFLFQIHSGPESCDRLNVFYHKNIFKTHENVRMPRMSLFPDRENMSEIGPEKLSNDVVGLQSPVKCSDWVSLTREN